MMKWNKLKPFIVRYNGEFIRVCAEDKVHEAITELQDENAELKVKLDKAIAERNGNQVCIDALKAEIKCKETVGQMWFERCMKARTENVGLERAIWLARAERYKMKEFIAREEGKMSWSRVLRERTYNQWVDQLLRIANLANKLQNKCRAKAEKFKEV